MHLSVGELKAAGCYQLRNGSGGVFFLSSASLEKQGPSSLEEGYSAHYTITIVIGNPKIAFLESRGLKSRHQEAQEAAQEAIKYYEQAREGDFGRF